MMPVKPVFLKTYGKQTRKVSAWISPQSRKQAFDSTLSTDGSASEPSSTRRRRLSVANHRVMRPAKKRAMQYLDEKSNDENIPPESPRQPEQLNKTTRAKKTSVSRGQAVRPAKRKAMMILTETSSDEESSHRLSLLRPRPAQQSKTTRKSCLVSVPGVASLKRKQAQMSSDSEDLSASTRNYLKKSLPMKRESCVHPPSVGRFVTRRRRAVAARPKAPLAASSILNSSDDFASGAFGPSRILPSRRRQRRLPPSFLVSSAENSLTAAGTVDYATVPFREISINESADHSLGPCSRKPMFCSTPSTALFSKCPRTNLSSNSNQCSSPLLMLESCIGTTSAFQEELCLPRQPTCSHSPASPIERHSEAHSSCFVSAAGGLEWLIEALKDKCLSDHCVVQLERLDLLTLTPLLSQTTYSSCLEQSSSVHFNHENPLSGHSARPSHHPLSEINEGNVAVRSLESPKYSALETDSQSPNVSSSVGCKETAELSSSNEETAEKSLSNHHTDSSAEIIMDTQLLSNSSLFTEEGAEAVKRQSLTNKCAVRLQRCTLSPVIVQQIKEILEQRDASLPPEANKTENDAEDLTCSESTLASVRQSVYCTGVQTLCKDTEGEENEALLKASLKEKCLNNKLRLNIKRFTISQVKEILQLSHKTLKSSTEGSDSASDDQAKTNQQPKGPNNHSNEDMKKSNSFSSEDKNVSDKEEVISHRRKRASQAPKEKKRRSTTVDRPGTTRKACVSGLSVSRWKNQNSTHLFRSRATHNKAVDCSINELISTQRKQPKELFGAMNFSTPVRANQFNLSSLLADLTPNTQTWSRLKAALSVHRKVLLTPKSFRLSMSGSPVRAELADISQDLFATPFRTSKHLQSQLRSCSSLVACEDPDLSDAEKVYAECGQSRPLPWEECISPKRMKKCVKIGEGTFGEVFSTTNAAGDTVALKVIPLEGSEKVNGEDQKTFGEILHEIIISKELSSLKEKQQNQTHGFIGLNDLHCVRGCYPPEFLKAWDAFDQKKGSENDRPDFFEEDQLFIILEFEFGGSDLENSNGSLASLMVAKSILHQVTAALAVAEQELRFEHRDLHWGNVLVKTTKEKKGSFLLNGTAHSLETKGVLVRIIDYSLSRLEIDDLTVSCDISNDEELFMGQGDYQFDIYRLMRRENGNNWSTYHPHTNVLWLHYLCSKLLSMKYRSSRGRGAKDMRVELSRFYDNILQYGSATEVLQDCPMFQ